jgi:predicted nucleotidyltransferase
MHRERNPNLEILERVVHQLGPLADQMVFLGGCATGMLLTDVAAPPIRATQDVDVITEVASVEDYHRLAKKLRARGFKEDQSPEAPICRWAGSGVLLDVMPTNPNILGFGNPWYQPALDHATNVSLPGGDQFRMVTGPYFLATKLAAFESRGGGDYLASHDLEDVIAVLDGRPEITEEIVGADQALRNHLAKRFAELLRDPDFESAVPGHLPGDAASQARAPLILARISAIVGIE